MSRIDQSTLPKHRTKKRVRSRPAAPPTATSPVLSGQSAAPAPQAVPESLVCTEPTSRVPDILTKDDIARRYFPDRFREKEIEHHRRIAHEEELARLEIREEHEGATGVVSEPTKVRPLRRKMDGSLPRGRKKSGEITVLEQALHRILRDMPEGGTLEDFCVRVNDKKIEFQTPASEGHPRRFIEYPDALKNQDYYNTIRMRFRKILGKKLLPKR
jgi:hypothetical protein